MLEFYFDNGGILTLEGYSLEDAIALMKKENTALYTEDTVIFLSKVNYIKEVTSNDITVN